MRWRASEGPDMPHDPSAEANAGPLNPAALTLQQAARMLGVGEDVIAAHVAAGAPTHAGGRLNIVTYAAWLLGQLGGR